RVPGVQPGPDQVPALRDGPRPERAAAAAGAGGARHGEGGDRGREGGGADAGRFVARGNQGARVIRIVLVGAAGRMGRAVDAAAAGAADLGIAARVDVRATLAALPPDWDVEIVERHHRHKKDSPSGTALLLAGDVRQARSLPETALRYGREGMVGQRPPGEVGVHSVRGGSWVGDHQVLLAAEGEWMELRHVAQDRAAFARGALAAVRFVATAGAGWYTI